ncbi:MAG: PTS system mannose/fructose/sorbose family transporter subunit IID [Gemmatimonadota bacterium]
MTPRRRDFVRSWGRTFAVQGSWNYDTMIGAGIAYCLAPLLRRIHAGDPVALQASMRRSLESFNSHPYLSGLAIGAIAKAELEGVEPERLDRFREALRGPLGSLGDRAVWATWRPLCLLAAIAAHLSGLSATWSVALFLVLYNAGHVALRTWALRTGWKRGLDLGSALRAGWLEWGPHRLAPLILLLIGVDVALLGRRVFQMAETGLPPALAAVGVVAAVVAFRWPLVMGRVAIGLILAVPAAWWLLGLLG